MKICLINNLFYPLERGGAEKIVRLIAEGLAEEHEVLVITSRPKDFFSAPRMEKGYKVQRIYSPNIFYFTESSNRSLGAKVLWHVIDLFNVSAKNQVKKILNDFKPDIVFTHNLKGLGLSVLSLFKNLDCVHVHTLHDYQLLEPHGSFFRNGKNQELNGLLYRCYRFFTRKLSNNCSMVIAPSKFILDKHLACGFFKKTKTYVLPNPIAVSKKNNLKLALPSGPKFFLGYLGQLEPHKGVEFLAKSFMKLENPKFELLIAGEGSASGRLKELVKTDTRIKILGKVKSEALPDFFSQINLLVIPSIWRENLPTVILEAYASGVPVLVSSSGGSKELVKSGETGWIFESESETDLLDKLKYVSERPVLLGEMGENCKVISREFSLHPYLQKLIAVCQGWMK